MKKEKISDAVTNIDQNIIAEAAEYKKAKKAPIWIKLGAVAACAAVLLGIGLPLMLKNDVKITVIDGLERPYKNTGMMSTELDLVWPWEYMTEVEKWSEIDIEGETFTCRLGEVSDGNIGKHLGKFDATGYDNYADEDNAIHTTQLDVYEIKGINPELLVAAKLGDKFYAYKRSEYVLFDTLGELLDNYSLSENVEFEKFSVYKKGEDTKHLALLEGDDYIWSVLEDCHDAAAADSPEWIGENRNRLSFTVTSDALGSYKQVFYVAPDGYIWTNALDYGHLYYIGTDAAEKIINYANENSAEAEPEHYAKYVIGKITEVGDDYAIIDDSVLCANPEDGITFRLSLDDMAIRRYFEFGGSKLGVGSLISVEYREGIDTANGNEILGARRISRVQFTGGGEILIEE